MFPLSAVLRLLPRGRASLARSVAGNLRRRVFGLSSIAPARNSRLPSANQIFPPHGPPANPRTPSLDFEQNKNKNRTIAKQEMEMTDLVQDVVSLLSMSTFIVTMAMWIGAM
jgi:hypothetical protein